MNTDSSIRSVARIAMLVSCLMLAHQVGSKAARDALFLSQFKASYFPLMVMAGAALSIAGGLLSSRILQALTPARMVPWTFLLSGVLHFAEWSLRDTHRSVMVILVYVHVVGLGAILLSSFWSLLSERFDPRSGKKYFGRIAGIGTLGGILGGLAAERFAVMLPESAILVFLGSLHLLCGGITFLVVRRSRNMSPRESPRQESDDFRTLAAWPIFQHSKYAKTLAALVVLSSTAAALLDIIFKLQAATLIGRGHTLLRFFAIFYTAGQILTFGVQILVTRKWLDRVGAVRSAGSLPAVVAAGSLSALVFPAFSVLVVTRALELILRSSVYRAGYELFFTPVPVQEKRAAKPVIDVVFDRFGDVLGGGVSQVFLALGGMIAIKGILLVVIGLSAAGIFVARLLGSLYVRALEKGLVKRANELDVHTSAELRTRSLLLRTLNIRTQFAAQPTAAQPKAAIQEMRRVVSDPILPRLADLRSGHADLVLRALGSAEPLDPVLVPQAIELLAWDDVAQEALRVLRVSANQFVGQMVDWLLDDKSDFAIKRRIPRVLAYADDRRAFEGLMSALQDSRFEVRFQCVRALDLILQKHPEYRPEPQTVFDIIEREMSVARGVWESRRLLDRRQSSDQFLFLDETLRERAQLSWEHLFSLLALILPREPLKIAFQALHTDDRFLRGLALEYLDSVLPASLRRVETIFDSVPLPSSNVKDPAARLLDERRRVSLKLANNTAVGADTVP